MAFTLWKEDLVVIVTVVEEKLRAESLAVTQHTVLLDEMYC